MMARPVRLPYKATNPRSIRGAKKRGWTVVAARKNYVEVASWMGLNIWCERTAGAYWISSFHYREFAFEDGKDALAFKMKWG